MNKNNKVFLTNKINGGTDIKSKENECKYYVVRLWKPSTNLSAIVTKSRYVFLNKERAEEELKRCQEVVDSYAGFKDEFKGYRCTMNVYRTYKLKNGDEIADDKDVVWDFIRSRKRLKDEEVSEVKENFGNVDKISKIKDVDSYFRKYSKKHNITQNYIVEAVNRVRYKTKKGDYK